MELLNLLKKYDLNYSDFVDFASYVEGRRVRKGDVFIRENERCNYLGILISGLMVAKYTSEKGDDIVSRFFYPHSNIIISNHESFYYDRNSTETIIALEESYIFSISKVNLKLLYEKFPQLECFGRKLAEESYIKAVERIHDLQSLKGKDRVRKFVETNKELLSKVNRQEIASYLGINRNDFSKYLSQI